MLVYWRVNLLEPLCLPNTCSKNPAVFWYLVFWGSKQYLLSFVVWNLKGKKSTCFLIFFPCPVSFMASTILVGGFFSQFVPLPRIFQGVTAFFTSNLPNVLRWRSFLYAYINHINCIQVSFSRGEWRAKEGPQRNWCCAFFCPDFLGFWKVNH